MPAVELSSSSFGVTAGREVTAFTLENSSGIRATILDYGCILQSLILPDSHGGSGDVVLGFDTLESYLTNPPYFGATVGRHANRIAGGHFTIDGTEHQLICNNDPGGLHSHLHGGISGFDKKIWAARTSSDDSSASVILGYTSPAGEENYPGTLKAEITYTLHEDNRLTWTARATTDAPTIVNLVNHSYWNLGPRADALVDDHLLQLFSEKFLPTNPGLIPLGEPAPVAYTPLDFIEPKPMGRDIHADYDPLVFAKGYDQAFILENGGEHSLAARVSHPDSGRSLEILTNQPAVHFYTGNFIDSKPPGKNGLTYQARCGFCLETENWPNSPNNPTAPSPILRPGETYTHTLECKFGW